jgi:hypothetical protein
MLVGTGDKPRLERTAMKLAQRLRSTMGELAFAAGTAGVVALTLSLLSVAAPSQMRDLCVSARSMLDASGTVWSCGAADRPITGTPPGQVIGGH